MNRHTIKIIGGIVGAIALVAAAGAWGYFEATKRAWIPINEYDIRSEGSLRVGDHAPDLELANADGSGPVLLSQLFADKPLVLVFGSYT